VTHWAAMTKLTNRQIEVLRELEGCEQSKYAGRRFNLPDGRQGVRMFTPMEFGGTSCSHHSATATTLAKMGLVDRYKYTYQELNTFNSRAKGACVYALTDAGRTAIAARKEAGHG